MSATFNVSFREAWVSLEIVYERGNERWLFYREKPDYVEETYLVTTKEHVPAKLVRIMYFEPDNVEIETNDNP